MRTQRWIAAGAACAVTCAVGLVVVGAGRAAALEVASGFGPGDGLNRYVVTLAPRYAQEIGDAELPGAAALDLAVPGGGAARGALDLDLVTAAQQTLGEGGGIEWRADGPWYVTSAGAAPVGGASVRTADQAPVALPVESATGPLEALEDRPGVDSAQVVGDGAVLLATDLSLGQVRALPEVATAEPSESVPVAADPDDPYYASYGWNLHNTGANAYGQPAVAGADVGAPEAWRTTLGEGAVVAVVDTGYDHDHPELAGALWTNPTEPCGAGDVNGNGLVGDCHGWNFYADSPDIDNGAAGTHGTSVSGTIAAALGNGQGSAGLAPGTRIMPLVVGGGENVDVLLAAKAFRYAADNGADVINASFGGTMTGYALDQLSAAIDYAVAHGVLVVVAAGNDSADRDRVPSYPASLPQTGIVTVGSSTASDTVADHSAWGAQSVDLFAPGQLTVAPWNDGSYRLVSGTSFAAPHVAAAAALYRSVAPELSVAELKAALLDTAERGQAFAGRSVSGGRLDVARIAELSTATTYTFGGMTGTAGPVSATITVASRAGAGRYTAELGLGMLDAGEVWALSGQSVSVAGQTVVTDDTGTVTVDLGELGSPDGEVLALDTALGPGAYALTVRLLRDGEPVGDAWAAPMLLAPVPQDGASSPGGDPSPDPTAEPSPGPAGPGPSSPGTDPGAPSPSPTTDPGAPPSSPGPGSSGPSSPGTDPAPPSPSPTAPTGPGAGSSGPGTPDPGVGDPAPGSGPAPTSPTDPGTPGGSSGGTPSPGSGSGGSSGGSGGGPSGDTSPGSEPSVSPSPGQPQDPAPSAPGPQDVVRYDRVGDFAVTSVTPVHVAAWGGDLVTVTGDGLDPGVSVLVGGTRQGSVLWAAGSFLMFLTPSATAGSHDLVISAPGRTSVLPDALVYAAAAERGGTTPQPGGTTPQPGGSDPGPAPDPAPGGGTGPGPAPDPAPGGGTDPGTSPGTPVTDPAPDGQAGQDSGSGADQGPVTRVGPNGERLVRSALFRSLGGLWGTSCQDTCRGVRL